MVVPRSAEYVDRGRINMATQETLFDYFQLLKDTLVKHGIMELNEKGDPIQESIKRERIYLADETGWGVSKRSKKVLGKKGQKHVFVRKSNDESHNTLMLGVCGNGDLLPPLVILEKSFPLLGEGEAELLPSNVLLSKTARGSMEIPLFAEWLMTVINHKQKLNPHGVSILILDNHSSRFSIRAIDLCRKNNLEMLTYPGHLTHILQGPDVVLNKPISTKLQHMIETNYNLSGNSDLSRVSFIAAVNEAVIYVCTPSAISKAFSATGIIPFDPSRVKLSDYPSVDNDAAITSNSPIKATCSNCRKENVELHPLVRNRMISKKLAAAFVYTPPPEKTKTKSKIVKTARIITSDEVRKEVEETERKKKQKSILKVKAPVGKKKISEVRKGKDSGKKFRKMLGERKDLSGSETDDSDCVYIDQESRSQACSKWKMPEEREDEEDREEKEEIEFQFEEEIELHFEEEDEAENEEEDEDDEEDDK